MKVAGAIEFAVLEQTPERVVGEMPVTQGILNPFGVAHAGAMLWFADVCATLLVLGKFEVSPGASGFPLGIALKRKFSREPEGRRFHCYVHVREARAAAECRAHRDHGNRGALDRGCHDESSSGQIGDMRAPKSLCAHVHARRAEVPDVDSRISLAQLPHLLCRPDAWWRGTLIYMRLMRTLVDLFSDEPGYVRIFAELDGYSYELSIYRPRPMADLFERLSGYDSVGAACEAARFQLLSAGPVKNVLRRNSRRRVIRSERYAQQSLPLVGY
jgi:acyl-coenzyme A thioesterase PaaI-like protein